MTEHNVLARLDAAGVSAGANEGQRRVLSTLSDEEAGLLISIKERLDAAGPDVTAHSSKFGGTFW